MANVVYTSFKNLIGKGGVNFATDTLKCALLPSTHTPDASMQVWADVSADEISGTGYTAGGAALANQSWNVSGTSCILDADDIEWTGASVTARYALIYKVGTVETLENPLICLLDFGENKGVTGGTFSVQFAALGVLNLS